MPPQLPTPTFFTRLSYPKWVEKGALVRIPGGPIWAIMRVIDGEVYLRDMSDTGEPPREVCWEREAFLACWVTYDRTRFDRDILED